MRTYQYYGLFILMLMGLGACKKEQSKSNPVYGAYQRLRNDNRKPMNEYYSFLESEKKVYLFTEDDYFIRAIEGGALRITGNTVQFDLGGLRLYDYLIVGDTLFLNLDGSNKDLILLRRNGVPSTPDQWMTPVEPTNFFQDSLSANGMTFYNGRLYVTTSSRSAIKVYNTNTRTLENVITMPNEYGVIEFAGGNLWSAPKYDNSLVRLNPTTGAILFTSAASSWGSPDALAFDGVNLQSVSNGTNLEYKIATNTFTHDDGPLADIRDMAYYDGRFYAVSGNAIHRLNGSLQEEKSWRINNFNVDAIAFDGTKFWVHGIKTGEYLSSFAQVELN